MMGAQLVARVYTSWTHLPDRPFRLLAYMALVCKDTDAKPKFFGGREALTGALGLADDDSGRRMARNAVSTLIDSGCIERARMGHQGKRSEYLLTLTKGDSRIPLKGDSGVRNRGTQESAKGDSGVRIGGPSSPPKEPRGTTKENTEETTSTSSVSVTSGIAQVAKASESRLALVRARADREAAS